MGLLNGQTACGEPPPPVSEQNNAPFFLLPGRLGQMAICLGFSDLVVMATVTSYHRLGGGGEEGDSGDWLVASGRRPSLAQGLDQS